MKRARRARQAAFLAEVEASLAELQPYLKIAKIEPEIVIEGSFLLFSNDGPFDKYQVRIITTDAYPEEEPKVYETGGRIPRTLDRHVNRDGDCCLTVWDGWLVPAAADTSFRAFMERPMHDFFLSQWWFEKKGVWPFGARPHGADGMLEVYGEVLGIPAQLQTVLTYLKVLAKARLKGHWPCPCGSRQKLRHCHRDQLYELQQQVPPKRAKRMLHRLKERLEKEGTGLLRS